MSPSDAQDRALLIGPQGPPERAPTLVAGVPVGGPPVSHYTAMVPVGIHLAHDDLESGVVLYCAQYLLHGGLTATPAPGIEESRQHKAPRWPRARSLRIAGGEVHVRRLVPRHRPRRLSHLKPSHALPRLCPKLTCRDLLHEGLGVRTLLLDLGNGLEELVGHAGGRRVALRSPMVEPSYALGASETAAACLGPNPSLGHHRGREQCLHNAPFSVLVDDGHEQQRGMNVKHNLCKYLFGLLHQEVCGRVPPSDPTTTTEADL